MHVRPLPSGKWRWIVQHNGMRLSGTADTRALAMYAGSQALIELGSTRPPPVNMTVMELLEVWQAERQRDWSPTYAADILTVTDRLPASFTGRHIAEVTPPILVALHRQLHGEGWSPHRIGRAHAAISQAFVFAVGNGWADVNPARDLRPPRVAPADVHAPDVDTVRRLVAAAPDSIRLVLRLATITGARLGELCALRWEDIDGDVVTIRRTVVWTPASKLQVRQTKTGRKGDRRLVLDERTVKLLEQRRESQAARAVEQLLPAPVYIFSNDAGITPWRPGYVGLEYRRLRDRVDGAGAVRFHDLRHHVATEMLAAGEKPVDVAAQLGHSTPATTLRVYAHYLPGRGGESARRRAGTLDD